ncbi:hypothetical protein [Agrobacterium larrymoorei]|uniref:Uncharacterized protein n=1 Tax=Agrobacterium larrymoorei TaxID=160699 RepID=A0ABU0UN45_9HYPH|nr:hypothetical protein [Agrobacterium larrymoorei]MDQ1186359.1 hypothetical protein [Agrobacterium larrymoorei]
MAYDWSGGRTRRTRQLKIGAALTVMLLAAFFAQLLYMKIG